MATDIKDLVDRNTLLLGLAEEAAELAQAALKLHRVLDGKNPTPVPLADAIKALHEEIADVDLYEEQVMGNLDWDDVYEIKKGKYDRWMKRLTEGEKSGDESD